jgi:hypothetical protein
VWRVSREGPWSWVAGGRVGVLVVHTTERCKWMPPWLCWANDDVLPASSVRYEVIIANRLIRGALGPSNLFQSAAPQLR